MKLKTILAFAAISIFTVNAHAQTATAKPVSTLKNDRQRIKEGVKSGELTPAEAARLKTQEVKLIKERKEMKEDGTVTPAERKEFRQDKKQLSRRIYRQKHDAQVAH